MAVTVFLALGSNVGDSEAHITQAISLLREHLANVSEAPIYRSKAVGYTDQPDFFNTAIKAETDLEPLELLKFVKSVEQQVGRVARFRWGPREIDIDIIFYGDQTLRADNLTIPHSSFAERDFVLKPICDLDPNWVDPVSKKVVRALYEELSEESRSVLESE